MSLLMDALRKAEEQKRKLAAEGGAAVEPTLDGLSLEPLPMAPELPGAPTGAVPPAPTFSPLPVVEAVEPGMGNLPELPTRLEDLDEQFIAHARAAPPKPPKPPGTKPAIAPAAPPPPKTPAPAAAPQNDGEAAARASARQLFEAKQPAAPNNRNNRSFAIAAGLLGLIGLIAVGGYFWWQLQPRGGLTAGGAMPPAAAVSQPVAAAPAPTQPVAQIAAAPQPAAVPPAPTIRPSDAGTDDAEEAEAAAPKRTAPPAPPTRPAARPASPIRVTTAVQKTDPLLEQAWQAFNRGEADLARSAWEKTLAADPRNAAALHGLAAIARQNGQTDAATGYYLRALEADPKDALALAALTTLRAPTDALQTESRLKTLLAEQPDSPYLHFALGSLYARGARWADAQQAYFRAHGADPANPDYLFNLAVSLDQLRQPRLAVRYYNQAIAAAAHQPAGFDTAQVAARLRILQAGE